MRLALAATILAAAAASATSAQDAKPEGELAKIQGKWTAMVGPEKNIPLTAVFTGKDVKIMMTIQEQEVEIKGKVKLDEAKSPKQWDWTEFEGPQGQQVEDNLSIYKLDGDKLTICSGGPGNDRPTEFKEGDGGPPNLVVFTRAKDDKKPTEKTDK